MGTTEATLRMENMEVKDEWQDEDFPRLLPEYGDMDPSCGLTDDRPSPPNSLNVSPPGGGGVASSHRKRRTLIAPELNLSLDHSEGSLLSDDFLDTPDDLDINVDDIDTPDETDSLEFITNGNELEWEDDAPVASAKAAPADGLGDAEDEGNTNGRLWRTVLIGEQEHRIDMQIIRPYLRVITHGGHMKFLNKIQYVHSLDELAEIVPMEHVHVPDCVVQFDEERIKARKERPKSMIVD
ncbi:hypothetical protein fugu_006116 [Takifugu bimaculatus]|uniref:Uncharacterized protein n=1 Tax=Takifugu bimaculatus TaxID=433685 RepID=A0A4Z2B769_9TELE|nr:hypothetical protein fugu_006116 [Takifugu bimaculatus]